MGPGRAGAGRRQFIATAIRSAPVRSAIARNPLCARRGDAATAGRNGAAQTHIRRAGFRDAVIWRPVGGKTFRDDNSGHPEKLWMWPETMKA